MSRFFSSKKEAYSIFGCHNSLEFRQGKNHVFLYGIMIDYKGSISDHWIHFLCEVNYLNDCVVQINQNQVYLNDQLPDLMMEA
ncbi:hypothetical protein [Myroides sp. LoEW2-1]|uniref:hypothetical protein n=1 Tax=Myroides sp. LoEW2-1 TaxID=2683192 RepID=UPI001322F043|nr:hypothetical protein [Myroides sp. LoEW2-1]MVX37313.1 hypothetical protein [Myroides sp. LoEW2-1]